MHVIWKKNKNVFGNGKARTFFVAALTISLEFWWLQEIKAPKNKICFSQNKLPRSPTKICKDKKDTVIPRPQCPRDKALFLMQIPAFWEKHALEIMSYPWDTEGEWLRYNTNLLANIPNSKDPKIPQKRYHPPLLRSGHQVKSSQHLWIRHMKYAFFFSMLSGLFLNEYLPYITFLTRFDFEIQIDQGEL
jgi:hypothetical protein